MNAVEYRGPIVVEVTMDKVTIRHNYNGKCPKDEGPVLILFDNHLAHPQPHADGVPESVQLKALEVAKDLALVFAANGIPAVEGGEA